MIIHQINFPRKFEIPNLAEFERLDARMRNVDDSNQTGEEDLAHLGLLRENYAAIASWSLTQPLLDSLCSKLLGQDVSLRTSHAFDRPVESRAWVRYPGPQQISGLLTALKEARSYTSPTLFSCVVYAMFLLAHPFIDGNGRTARFLVRSALVNAKMLCAYSLPLEEVFRQDRSHLVHGLQSVGLAGDWHPLAVAFIAVLDEAVSRAEHRETRVNS